MTNFEFLNKFLDFQKGVFYNKIFEFGFARTVYSENDGSVFANYSLINRILEDRQFSRLKTLYEKINRKMAFYFEDSQKNKQLKEYLLNTNFEKKFEDSWMFYSKKRVSSLNLFEAVREVDNEFDLKTFIDIFDRSYTKDDPQNPYGEVKNFIPSTISAWKKFHSSGRLKYFIIYKGNVPGAVSILNSFEGIGYILCVGSLREFRGFGLGKAATLYAVKTSIDTGNNLHCLATEEGTYPNEFYKRIGFVTKFTALEMSRKEGKN